MSSEWKAVWAAKATEDEFTASGRSSGDAVQLFALLTDAASALRLGRADRLLDLGAGTGLLGRHLRPHVACLVAMDLALPLVMRNRAEGNATHWVTGDAVRLPFGPARFTRVLFSSVLQYLGNEAAVAAALGELRRVVGPGARAFASGNPDTKHREEYIAGIDRLDLPEERKAILRERNRSAFWLDPARLCAQASAAGWEAEVRPIAPLVWQSFYMFDLLLIAR